MNAVEPIKDKDLLDEIKQYLKEKNPRDFILFYLGIQTGLRISDILNLKVKDVEGIYIELREKKTKKKRRIRLAPPLKKELRAFCADKNKHEYLFKSREGRNKPITRQMAYKILRDVGDEFGIESIGTHSLRKTFGYHFHKKNKDITLLMEIFNHCEPSLTLRYIGMKQETFDDAMRKFRI